MMKYLLSALLLAGIASAASLPPDSMHPNIVFIYGDDVGFGDVGAYGAKLIPTPNIDRLAQEGLLFTDGHSSAATCSPSRFSLLTGMHAFRDGVSILPPNAPLCIPTDILTLPDMFRKAGYTTGVIGKWHLGIGSAGVPTDWNGDVKPGPLEIGFDFSFLLPSTNDRVPSVYLLGHRVVNLDPADPIYVGKSPKEVNRPGSTQYPDAKVSPEAMTYYQSTHGHNNSVINGIGRIGYMAGGKSALWNDETMSEEFVKQANDFISSNKEKPFLLYYCAQNIHVPRAPSPRFQGATQLGYRGDSMVEFDWVTGEIMKILKENGLDENTIVIFSSDNGPVYDDGYADGTSLRGDPQEVDHGHDASGIWRGGKYQIYEGGTRVPFIIRWPGKIQPGTSDAMVNQLDFFASFASLLNIKLADNEAPDSRNTLGTFLGKDFTGVSVMAEEAGRSGRALRSGPWKYVAPVKRGNAKKKISESEAALYNLSEDPGEQKNVSASYPEKTQEMDALLNKIMQEESVRKTLGSDGL